MTVIARGNDAKKRNNFFTNPELNNKRSQWRLNSISFYTFVSWYYVKLFPDTNEPWDWTSPEPFLSFLYTIVAFVSFFFSLAAIQAYQPSCLVGDLQYFILELYKVSLHKTCPAGDEIGGTFDHSSDFLTSFYEATL